MRYFCKEGHYLFDSENSEKPFCAICVKAAPAETAMEPGDKEKFERAERERAAGEIYDLADVDAGETAGERTPDAELDAMVRDFCAVGPKPKSEVRSRILAYAKQRVEQDRASRLGTTWRDLAEQNAELVKKALAKLARLEQRVEQAEREVVALLSQRDFYKVWNIDLAAKVAALERERDTLKIHWNSALKGEDDASRSARAAELKLKEMREALRTAVTVFKDRQNYNPRGLVATQSWLENAERLLADQ